MKKQIYDEKNGMSYTLHGDYYLPDLVLREEESAALPDRSGQGDGSPSAAAGHPGPDRLPCPVRQRPPAGAGQSSRRRWRCRSGEWRLTPRRRTPAHKRGGATGAGPASPQRPAGPAQEAARNPAVRRRSSAARTPAARRPTAAPGWR